jgi:hypothetical protein
MRGAQPDMIESREGYQAVRAYTERLRHFSVDFFKFPGRAGSGIANSLADRADKFQMSLTRALSRRTDS